MTAWTNIYVLKDGRRFPDVMSYDTLDEARKTGSQAVNSNNGFVSFESCLYTPANSLGWFS